MKYTRKWEHIRVEFHELDASLNWRTDRGWSVHSIFPMRIRVNGQNDTPGVCAVFFKDEPDLSGGVPR